MTMLEANEPDADPGEDQAEFRRRTPAALRMRQLRMDVQAQLVDAQRTMARTMLKSARYMLWATVISAMSSVVTVIAVLYSFMLVSRVSH